MSKQVHIPNDVLRAERMQNAKFVTGPGVQSRSVGERIADRNAWHRRTHYQPPAGGVTRLPCGCDMFVAAGSLTPECPMHDVQKAAA